MNLTRDPSPQNLVLGLQVFRIFGEFPISCRRDHCKQWWKFLAISVLSLNHFLQRTTHLLYSALGASFYADWDRIPNGQASRIRGYPEPDSGLYNVKDCPKRHFLFETFEAPGDL